MMGAMLGRGLLIAAAVLVLGVGALGSAGSQALAQADIPNVSGRWAVAIELDTGRCRWEGSVTLRQLGTRITGWGRARPVDRDRRCPPLGGDIEGAVTGPRIGFGFATGTLGQARFDGTYDPKTGIMEGTWRARIGAGLKAIGLRPGGTA